MIEQFVLGRVGYVVLSRAEKRNALSRAMWRAIPDVVARMDQNNDVRVILLHGAGGHFAAGADIAEFDTVYATRESASAYAADLAAAMNALAGGEKPRIAAISGVCFGGGVAISLCCDVRFAAEDASFAIPPAKLGLAYSFEDTRRLVLAVGGAAARDLLFSARTVGAAEAFRLGLVDHICERDEVQDKARAYADRLASLAPGSIWVARDFIARALAGQQGEDAATREAYLDVLESADFAEGKRAFLQKRAPKF